MRPRDWFGVAVRVIGLWEIVQGLYYAFWGVLRTNAGLGSAPAAEHYVFAAYYFALGLLLMFCADPIVWLFYGLPPKVAAQVSREDGTSHPPAGE